jgi:aminoglycoside phosphotransferase (APT) family kinase protein
MAARSESQRLADYLAVVGYAGTGQPGDQPALVSGQFHDVVLVGDVAYRFPRDDQSRRALPGRVALLHVLMDSAFPVATPVPLATAPAGEQEALGRCYVALSRLRGRPLRGPLDPRSEPAVLGELGRLLGALSELGADPAVVKAVPGADPDRWTRFADDVARVLFPLMSDRGRRRAEAELARATAVDPAGTALVHGDLGGTNLLWDAAPPGPRLAGILDWDEAHLGSQAEDLASLAATFGWPLAERLAAAWPAGGGLLDDARAIAATFALQQALPAALSADSAMLADGLTRYV